MVSAMAQILRGAREANLEPVEELVAAAATTSGNGTGSDRLQRQVRLTFKLSPSETIRRGCGQPKTAMPSSASFGVEGKSDGRR